MKQRMVSQDIAKGIAILTVVMLHTVLLTREIGTPVFLLFGFGMPFFLFMSGYNYNNRGGSPWKTMITRVRMLVNTILHYSFVIFILMGVYFLIRKEATVPELIQSYAAFLISKWGARLIGWNLPQQLYQRLLGPYWFLQFLTTGSVLFYLCVDQALKSRARAISMIALLSSMSCVLIELHVVLPWGIQHAPAVAAVMVLAAWLHKENALFNDSIRKVWVWINSIAGILIIALIQIKHPKAGMFGAGSLGEVMGGAEVYVLLVISVLFTYYLVSLSRLVEKIKGLSDVLAWLGRHTLPILTLHMTIMHILKDILGLPQLNAAEEAFAEKIEPRNALAYILTLLIVSGIILFQERWSKWKSGGY